ncbi:MAG TPA: helix-turn-helix transcriptional regulator [Candidatus Paceibacterota bacterium]|nr:helix-turn-helix transcriptional regulator [Candidatus Paceibacterota bacterium]HSA37180.1 helix-turn-helix transcriptional regulator [Candidatus Paceibacterota bacterium]
MTPLQRLKRSTTLDNLWIYILALLKKRPLYGWEIPDLIEKEFQFRPGKITPYRVLYRLQLDKFVKSRIDQRRRVYQISAKGEKEFDNAYEELRGLLNLLDGKHE